MLIKGWGILKRPHKPSALVGQRAVGKQSATK
jgi:hypothetical protein